MVKERKAKSTARVPVSLLIERLRDRMGDFNSDSVKIDKGNKAAGVRVRVGLQAIIRTIKIIRAEILEQQKVNKKKKKG